MKIGYGKIGRSMPLTLDRCGNLGGDVEMAAVVKRLALRHPTDEFWLLGRNHGEVPTDVSLPGNVINPWTEWGPELRRRQNAGKMNYANLTVDDQIRMRDIFRDMTEKSFVEMDAHLWWVGQHGTCNTPMLGLRNPTELTRPQDSQCYYSSFIMQGCNAWRELDPVGREEVFLNADARNKHKMRDYKWPFRHPVLGQFDSTQTIKHERYGDPSGFDWWATNTRTTLAPDRGQDPSQVWMSKIDTVYSRLEINGLYPGTPFGDLISYDENWDRPGRFGLFINEARSYVSRGLARRDVMREWILPLEPYFIHGTWSKESKTVLGRDIIPAPWELYYPRLHSVRTTFTTPSSGSGWATAKPWEAFAAGTVCFFHPAYDSQNHILADAPKWLQIWLRVPTATDLRKRVEHLNSRTGAQDWRDIVRAQYRHFTNALVEERYMNMIETRIYGESE
jgi:hypothetical protein